MSLHVPELASIKTESVALLERYGLDPAEMYDHFLADLRATLAGRSLRDEPFDVHASVDRHLNEARAREEHIRTMGFAVLTPAVVQLVSKYSPLLEVGAGSGYWSYELSRAGADIIATDPGEERYARIDEECGRWTKLWFPIEKLRAHKAIAKYPDRNLLMSWPSIGKQWSAHAANVFRGEYLIHIGEGHGGCTGCDQLYKAFNKLYEEVEEVTLPQFFGIHDRLTVYRRKP